MRRRADGVLVEGLSPTRQVMPYLMRSRTESAVYLEQRLDLSAAMPWLAERAPGAGPFELLLWALTQTIDRRPRLNRFVAGGRLYQRDGIWVSWAAKQAMSDDAPLVALKRRFDPAQSFDDMVRGVERSNQGARSGEHSSVDTELRLLLRLPGPARRAVFALERAADAWGLLPRSFVEPDPMFASVFVANLGSVGLDAAFHHLYEYGTIGVFCTLGRYEETSTGRTEATVRFTFDERVADGLYAQRSLAVFRSLMQDPGSACPPASGLGLAQLAPSA
jgi:hypothetical protein